MKRGSSGSSFGRAEIIMLMTYVAFNWANKTGAAVPVYLQGAGGKRGSEEGKWKIEALPMPHIFSLPGAGAGWQN